MKAMKVKQKHCIEIGRLGFCLNHHMAQRFIKNGWSHVQLNGFKYKARISNVYGKTEGVFFKKPVREITQ